jgi:hypothetical protein
MSSSSPWLARCLVLSALVATVWLAGPRAYAALASRLAARAGAASPLVDLGRVGILELPAWLRGPLLLACLEDLSPRLSGMVAIMDEGAALRTKALLEASPFVRQVRLSRAFPDRFVTTLGLREPVLEVHARQDAGAQDPVPLAYLDRDGVLMPAAGRLGLPRVLAIEDPRKSQIGSVAEDPRLRAAAAVAVEWNELVLPKSPRDTPRLREVDASNLGMRFLADGKYSEIVLGLERPDHQLAWLAYTHPPGSKSPRVGPEVHARVLTALLKEHPRLEGVEFADLRLERRWRDWVRTTGPVAEDPVARGR